MSIKNTVFDNFVDAIKSLPDRDIGKVSTKPIEFGKLARTAFPLVYVTIANEEKEDITMTHRMSTLFVEVTAYVQGKSKTADTTTQVNNILALIEDKVEEDRARGGKALLTELRETGELDESAFPIVSQTHTYVIQYVHTRGTS